MNYEKLVAAIDDSGIKRSFIAMKMGITKRTFYNKLNGASEWTAREIELFCKTLGLTKRQRDDIFFASM